MQSTNIIINIVPDARSKYRAFLQDRLYQNLLPYNYKLFLTLDSDRTRGYNELDIIDKTSTRETTVALDDILKPVNDDGKPIRFVLIEGTSGTGKTTLAYQVCRKWARKELDSLKDYDLAILVRLRKNRAQDASTLEDLLPRCDDVSIMEDVRISIGGGKRVLIVCDGLDELPHEQLEKPLYKSLFSGDLLPAATVIVTSRPSASADCFKKTCQQNLDKKLEIKGFTDEGFKEFAVKIFGSGTSESEQFTSYVTGSYPIRSMMTLPLSAVIVATIYQDNIKKESTDHPFPNTMSELFEAFTKTMIRRHLDKEIPCSLQDFNKLSSLVDPQFPMIAEIAYVGICENKYVFHNLGEEFDSLGLMKKPKRTQSLSTHRAQVTHVFFHHALQEYLAALHIANKLSSQLSSIKFLKQKDMVLRFLAGMCDDNHDYGHALCQQLAEFLGQICFERPRGPLQLVHCATECTSIMHKFKVEESKQNEFIIVLPEAGIDWYAIGHCISHFDVRWGLHTTSLRKENIDLLEKGLNVKSPPTNRLKHLHISKSEVSVSEVITSLGESCRLECLQLLFVNIEEKDEEALKKLIAPGSGLKSLTYRTVNEYIHTRSILPTLFDDSSLEELVVRTGSKVSIGTELLPHSNTNLKKLTISCRLVQPLEKLLSKTSLTHLVIESRVYEDDLLILKGLVASVSTLQVLELGKLYESKRVPPYIPLESVSPNLCELAEIARSSQLKELKLAKKDYDYLPAEYHDTNSTFCITDSQ